MQLKRRLNLFDATLLVIGNVVGAGIFTTSGFLAGELPQPLLFVAIWVIGGLLTLCGALTYAEMAGMFPRSGGDYQFLKEAYGPWAGFLLGWVSFWVITPGSIAVLSIAMVAYIKGFLPLHYALSEKFLAVAVIFLLSFINYRGVRLSGTVQDIFTLGNLLIILALILGGLTSGNGNWQHFTAASSASLPFPKLFGPAMIAVLFTYSGWFASAYIGAEVKKPERNLPFSLLLGTIIVTLFYTAINLVYLYALPLSQLKGTVNVAQITAGTLFNPRMAQVVSLSIILAISGSINATILGGTRIYYAMAEDKIFWSPLKKLHPKYGTPHFSILSQMILACILVSLGTFGQLLSYVVFVMLLSSIAAGVAHFILRLRKPGLPRPYRTGAYPVVPLLFICFYIWIAAQIAYAKPLTSIAGLLIALSGLPFFIWLNTKRLREENRMDCRTV
ncbi:MAG: amino acid permease [Thermodesulfobacteriota bacterium]|jgi:APA family basic amino acid/polyamine antiporter